MSDINFLRCYMRIQTSWYGELRHEYILYCNMNNISVWRCHLKIWDSHPLKECKVVWRITIWIYFVLQCERVSFWRCRLRI